jgi:hypothetical protein
VREFLSVVLISIHCSDLNSVKVLREKAPKESIPELAPVVISEQLYAAGNVGSFFNGVCLLN